MKDYKIVGEFKDGYAKIRYFDGKYGFVHLHGDVIEGRYDAVEEFLNGTAYVKLPGGRWVPINRDGKIVTNTYNFHIEASEQDRKDNAMSLKNMIDDKIDGLNSYIDNMFDYMEEVNRKYLKNKRK